MSIQHAKITAFLIAMMTSLSVLGSSTKYTLISVERETIFSVFKRAGQPGGTLIKILDIDREKVLTRLKTGSEIEFFIDGNNALKKMNVLYKGELISSFSVVLENNEPVYISNNKITNKQNKPDDKASSIKNNHKVNGAISNFLVKNPRAKETLSDPHSVSKCLAGNIVSAALLTNKAERNKVVSLTTKIASLAIKVQGGNSGYIIGSMVESYVEFYTYNERVLIEDLKINECANLNTSVWNSKLP